MKISKSLVIAVIIISLLFTAITLRSYSEAAAVPRNNTILNEEHTMNYEKLRGKLEVKIFKGIITSVTNESINVESDDFTGSLFANGRWIYITGDYIGFKFWIKVYNEVKEGEALIVMASINRDDKIINLLLGLKQEELTLLRPIVLKHGIKRYAHTNRYFGIYGTILYKGNNYMLIANNGHKALVAVGENSTWYKAGYGVVTWREIRNEFNDGDKIRIFCHNILILNNKLAEYFGFKAIIWGYSGAIINLTSGTAITKYVSKDIGR